jgi:hypothetical protein
MRQYICSTRLNCATFQKIAILINFQTHFHLYFFVNISLTGCSKTAGGFCEPVVYFRDKLYLSPSGVKYLYRCRLLFGRCWVWTSVGTPSIVAEVLCGFPQSLHANSGIVPRLGCDCFLPNPFHFIDHRWSYRSKLCMYSVDTDNIVE